MGKKKGRTGQKKQQGPKAKALHKVKKAQVSKAKAKGKVRKSQSKAVKTNLKKMSFTNSKKIEALNSDVTKVLLAPPKLTLPSTSKTIQKRSTDRDGDLEMPDVSTIEKKIASL